MKLTAPEISTLPSQGLFTGRKPKAIFLRKHNLKVNLEAVKEETANVAATRVQEWLFLVEGYKKYHSIENLFLDNLVEDLDIKTEDPIKPPFTSEISDAASVEKVLGALSVLVMDHLDFIAESQSIKELDNQTLEVLFNQNLNVVAKAFDVSPKSLRREFSRLSWCNETVLNQQLLALSKKRRQLIDESNSQSKVKLAEVLNTNRHPNLFIMSGIEHATIFTQEKKT